MIGECDGRLVSLFRSDVHPLTAKYWPEPMAAEGFAGIVADKLYDLPPEVPVIDDVQLAEQVRVGRNLQALETDALTRAYFPQLAKLTPATVAADFYAGLDAFLESQTPIDDADIDAMYAAQMDADEDRADAERAEAEMAEIQRAAVIRANAQRMHDQITTACRPAATNRVQETALDGDIRAFVLSQADAIQCAVA